MSRKPGKANPDWRAASAEGPVTGKARPQQARSPSELLEPARAQAMPAKRSRPKGQKGGRQRGALTVLNGLFTVVLLIGLALGGAFYAMRYMFEQPGPLDHSTVVVIPPGDGLTAIAGRLQKEGVIADSKVLLAGLYWSKVRSWAMGTKAPVLKAGEYEIARNASMRQVVETLTEGKAILMKVSVPEGLTSYQIVKLLEGHADLTGTVKDIPAEGTLLPDTYKFSRGTDRNEILARMQADMKRFLAKQWETRSSRAPFKTVDEAINLASLVEKETGKSDERDRVAGVFMNRLAKKMRLQSDPTIIYHVTGGKGALGRGITRSEIDDKNAYNTYQIPGLPPTPICNPGRAAIEAVLNPAQTEDLYFVADGSGGHAFAANIRDHQNNVIRWRQIEREAKAKAAAGAAADTQTAGPGVALEMPGVAVDNGAAPAATPAPATVAAPATTEKAPSVAASTAASADTSGVSPAAGLATEAAPAAKPAAAPTKAEKKPAAATTAKPAATTAKAGATTAKATAAQVPAKPKKPKPKPAAAAKTTETTATP